MKLTPFGKFFLFLVIVAVVGFIAFKRYGGEIKNWAGAGQTAKGVLPSGMACYDPAIAQPTYDISKAKQNKAKQAKQT